jgi:cytochrome b6-f complex iron-sulfur subunit
VSSPALSRRSFIKLSMAALGAAWAGVFVQQKIFPSDNATAVEKPVEFPLSELPVGGTRPFMYAGKAALAIRTPESVKAFSLVCTHLGCLVKWQPAERNFYCPCHEGFYDEFGEVVSGPPPVPLESIPAKIAGDVVVIGDAA